jgi:prostaglandin-endoperoxide synthase 2
MTLDPCVPGTTAPKKIDAYTSWDSLTDRTYTGRHLPPAPEFNAPGILPPLEAVKHIFRKRNGVTRYSEKSTLLFPYFVQWFTDGFLRTSPTNQLKNTSNHQIDLCTVYGVTRAQTLMLRSMSGGKLKSQWLPRQDGVMEEYPPFFYADASTDQVDPQFAGLYTPLALERLQAVDRKEWSFAMGVERANIQIGFVMLNTLILREHNRVCGLLARHHPDWDDERLFQTARNILIVMVLRVILGEYIHHITPYHFRFFADPPAFTNSRWHRENWMAIEFSFVYRWHSTVPETIRHGSREIALVDTLWNNRLLVDHGLGRCIDDACSQPGSLLGLCNTPDFPISKSPDGLQTFIDVTELATVALGRRAQLASYNDYRELCRFPRVNSFDQITGDEDLQQRLRDLYGHPDRVEFFVGLYAEDVRPGSTIPPLVARLIGIDAFSQALTNPLLAPHVFVPETFSRPGWDLIHATSHLADIVMRNVPPESRPRRVSFDLDRADKADVFE